MGDLFGPQTVTQRYNQSRILVSRLEYGFDLMVPAWMYGHLQVADAVSRVLLHHDSEQTDRYTTQLNSAVGRDFESSAETGRQLFARYRRKAPGS